MWANSPFFFVFTCAALVASRAIMPKAVDFAADPSIDVDVFLKAAKKGQNVLETFPSGTHKDVKIFGDWKDLDGVSAIHFTADMDVDCDGVNSNCKGNPDGQSQTSFGHLDATKVPFFVIPETFFKSEGIKDNALGAIICNGKMYYAIMGDTNGDEPEVIGEASISLAQTCFPKEGLDGGHGHPFIDVLYVLFGNKAPTGVRDKTIDIKALKTLGDQEVKKLADALVSGI